MTTGADLTLWLESKLKRLTDGSVRALSEAMEAGENITKHNIETRGTEASGKRGRIDTGKMLDKVDSKTEILGDGEAEGRFGWTDKEPFYARFQEDGTRFIEPMYALSDAAEEVLVDYLSEMDDVVRGA